MLADGGGVEHRCGTPLVLVGAGGLGREVLAAVRAANRLAPVWDVRGFVDDRSDLHGAVIDGEPVLGPVSHLTDGSVTGCRAAVCIARPAQASARGLVAARLRDAGVQMATVIHPSAVLAEGTQVGEGSVLLAHVVTSAPILIGRHVVVEAHVVFTHDDVIADHATFGSGVVLAGGVVVQDGAYIGQGALVREALTIGAGALVGMGAVVTRDIPAGEVWVGNPARPLRPGTRRRAPGTPRGSPAGTAGGDATVTVSSAERRAADRPVPLVDVVLQHTEVADEVDAGLARLMATGAFIDGPDVAGFEAEFSAFSGARDTVGVASGTDALEISLRAAGVRPGDEVIVPAHTFVATAEAVLRAGAMPVLVDVDADHLLMDPAAVDAAVSPRTAAVVPVHLYGQMAPVARIAEIAARCGLAVIADAAQAQGASASGTGVAAGVLAAATSFYPGKNIGAYGDAGAVVTDDAQLAGLARSIGHHGTGIDRYRHERIGFTSRLDTVQAVVLRAKLARLEKWNDQRRAAAALYDELLAGVDGVTLPATAPGNVHVWHLYAVRVDRRDEVLARLRQQGIGAGVHYPFALHQLPALAGAVVPGELPVATAAAASVLSLPLFPGITEAQQERVTAALVRAVRPGSDE